MRFISHRGNIDGRNEKFENHPDYLLAAMDRGYEVECDVWEKDGSLYLGHNEPLGLISQSFLRDPRIWTHCKNIEALSRLVSDSEINCFFHQQDPYTLTSQGYIWCYPGSKVPSNGICVVPERVRQVPPEDILGICSDFISGAVGEA